MRAPPPPALRTKPERVDRAGKCVVDAPDILGRRVSVIAVRLRLYGLFVFVLRRYLPRLRPRLRRAAWVELAGDADRQALRRRVSGRARWVI